MTSRKAPVQAAVLTGGLGTRLGALTRTVPKPLLPVLDVPFVEHLIRNLARHGFTEILLLCGYKPEQFEALTKPGAFGDVRVRLSVEPPELLGTGGALRHARELLDDVFVMLNGDTWFNINVLDLTTDFGRDGERIRIALRPQSAGTRYGGVVLADERITAFGDRVEGATLINGGVYCVDRRIIDLMREGPCSLERDVFPRLAEQGVARGRIHDQAFLDIGVPDDLARADAFIRAVSTRPAAFLDRDGVLNHDDGYTHRPERLVWIDGAREAVRLLNDAGYNVFVVSNQAGVARGFYGCAEVEAFHRHMNEELRQVGAHIDRFEYCPFHPEGVAGPYRGTSPRRKPEPGMILDLLAAWPTELGRSFLVGDKASDIEAAERASLPGHLFKGGDLKSFIAAIIG